MKPRYTIIKPRYTIIRPQACDKKNPYTDINYGLFDLLLSSYICGKFCRKEIKPDILQFWRPKIRRSMFLGCIKFADPRIVGILRF